nr:MAG TPA: hypothetical protein [Caudoviricetes sp.]
MGVSTSNGEYNITIGFICQIEQNSYEFSRSRCLH